MSLRRLLISFPALAGAALLAVYALAGIVAVPAFLERLIADLGASSLLHWAWTFDQIEPEQPAISPRSGSAAMQS
jgi:hypothetical protein